MSKHKPFRNKPSREGERQPGRDQKENEFKPGQRNPEPTTRITEPPPQKPGAAEARFDRSPVDGDNRATNDAGTSRPVIPMPHDDPDFTESPEAQLLRVAELLAFREIASGQVVVELTDWLEYNRDKIKSRQKLEQAIDFFAGRMKNCVQTVLEGFHRAISENVPLDDPKKAGRR